MGMPPNEGACHEVESGEFIPQRELPAIFLIGRFWLEPLRHTIRAIGALLPYCCSQPLASRPLVLFGSPRSFNTAGRNWSIGLARDDRRPFFEIPCTPGSGSAAIRTAALVRSQHRPSLMNRKQSWWDGCSEIVRRAI
jgi:hypothetical protein